MTEFDLVGLDFISLWWGFVVLNEWMGGDHGFLALRGQSLSED